MLSKDILSAPADTEWAVINPSQENKRRDEGHFTSVEPRRVLFGKRVNGLHYNLYTDGNHGTWSYEKDDFKTTNARVFGYLVELPARTDIEPVRYIVVKATNFIETKDVYNKHWIPLVAQREAEEAVRRAEYERRQANEERRRTILRERDETRRAETSRLKESVRQSISVLLGSSAESRAYVDIGTDHDWVNIDTPQEELIIRTVGTVKLDVKDFLRLLDKVGN